MASKHPPRSTDGGKKILFINPPVVCASRNQVGWYSFGHPTSILKLSRYHKKLGHRVSFIDCMDYVEPEFPRLRFYKKMPLGAARLKARRSTYVLGRSFQWLRRRLQQEEYPDEIWLSCHITFNNELAHRTIKIARERFPKAEILFGGNYPTLFPEDAGKSGATSFVGTIPEAAKCFPDYSIFERGFDYIVFQMILGCKNHCTHCLNHLLTKRVVRFEAEEVAADIERSRQEFGVRMFVNIDPNPAAHGLAGYLEQIAAQDLDVELYLYGGIQPNLVTKELVRLMKRAKVKGFTLPSELGREANARLNKSYSENDFYRSVRLFQDESYDLSKVHCPFPVGLKFDQAEEIIARIREIIRFGMIPEIAPVALVPGTIEYQRHLSFLEGKSLEELNWALWPSLDTMDKIKWYSRLMKDDLAGFESDA